jgi:ATP-dependent RNA helicase DDX60
MSFVFEPIFPISDISDRETLQRLLHNTLLRLEKKQSLIVFPPINTAALNYPDSELETTNTEVLSWIASTLWVLSRSADFPSEIIFFFLIHCLLLPNLPIELRAQKPRSLHPQLEQILFRKFIPTAFLVVEHVCKILPQTNLKVDGYIFASVLQFCLSRRPEPSTLEELLGPSLFASAQSICVNNQVGLNLTSFIDNFPSPDRDMTSISRTDTVYHLLPITNRVFDDQLKLVRAEVVDDESEDIPDRVEFDVGVLFKDTKHWHNSRKSILPSHLAGSKPPPLNDWQKMKQLKSHQRFMTNLHRQAVTLTGASGGVLERVSIASLGNKRIVYTGQKVIHLVLHQYILYADMYTSQMTQTHAPSGLKGKKEKPISKKDKLLLDRAQEKLNQETTLARDWWSAQLEKLKKLSIEDQVKYLDDEVLRNRRAKQLPLAIELQLYRLQLDFKLWINQPDRSEQSVHDRFSLSILRRIKGIFDLSTVDAAVFKILSSALSVLGFSNLISSFSSRLSPDPKATQSLQFKFMKLVHSKTSLPVSDCEYMSIKEDPTSWQLRLFGEFMDRSMDSIPDPKKRVQFAPDAWQRKVLDAIDEEASLLVVGMPEPLIFPMNRI